MEIMDALNFLSANIVSKENIYLEGFLGNISASSDSLHTCLRQDFLPSNLVSVKLCVHAHKSWFLIDLSPLC